MLQNINLKPKSSNVSSNITSNVTSNIASNDTTIAKNIVDILFVFIDGNIRNDIKMTGFTKGLILSQLPGIRNGSRNYISDMSSANIRKLLDNIQNQLKNRR